MPIRRTGWVTGGDGLLAQDSNSNGIIDNIDELFGSATQSGFGELAALDSNADGKITSADTAWSTLKLWVDADGDGVTDAGELNTLAAHNITELGLAAKTVNQNVNGNILVETSTFVMNGETRTLGEVLFEIDPTNSIYAGEIGEISWDALSLPFLRGYGVVADTPVAMSLDAALLAAGENLAAHAALGDFEAFRAEMRAFMFKWAGVEGVDKDSRNAKLFAADAQELAFLEKYTGINFETPWNENDPGSVAQWAHVADAFDHALQELAARFLVQTDVNLQQVARYDLATDEIVLTAADMAALDAAAAHTIVSVDK